MKPFGKQPLGKCARQLGPWLAISCLLGVIVLALCCRKSVTPVETKLEEDQKKPASLQIPADALTAFNRGAAMLDMYKYELREDFAKMASAFESALEKVPNWEAPRFNLGLACMNATFDRELNKKAPEHFETILKANPDNLYARFCLGLCCQYSSGDLEKALQCFEAVYERDKTDPLVVYKCGEILASLDQNQKAIEMFQKTLEMDPGFISAAFGLSQQYRILDQDEEERKMRARFKDLDKADLPEDNGNFKVGKKITESGKYYRTLGADNLPWKTPAFTRRVLFSPEVRRLSERADPWDWAGGSVGVPGIAVADVDGDGHLDLCLAGVGPKGATRIWHNDGKGNFTPGPVLAEEGVSPILGDVDNQGQNDLWLGTASGTILFKNQGKGKFTRQSRPGLPGPTAFTAFTWLFDIDQDGDLDPLAFRLTKGSIPSNGPAVAAPSAVYQNNQNGTWTDVGAALGLNLPQTAVACVVQGDFDNDMDLDLILFFVSGKPLAWVNDRAGKFHLLDAAKTGLDVEGVIGASLGDPNKDGKSDLLIFARDGVHLFLNQGGFRFAEDQDFRNRFGGLKGTGGQFADMSNSGHQDIVIADAHRRDGSRGPVLLLNDGPQNGFLDALEADPGNLLGAIKFKGNASCVVADFCGRGRCDILLAPSGENPMLLQNLTPGGHWVELDLVGTRTPPSVPSARERTPNSPIGARVEIRTGNLYQQYLVGVSTGPVSVAPLRIHAGIGENTKVDWVRIIWPESILQGEIDLAADQVHQITEKNRKPSSCPHLFAWDGSHFQFVSDFGGKGGLGYLVAPGQYALPDPREYLRLPHLEPVDGDYVLQVMEPLEEIVFLDEARLIAVDHPAGTEVYPQEMMAVNARPPGFGLVCFQDTIEPVQVVDHRGADVTEQVRRLDRRYAGATDLDPRFPGFARDHHVDLDFGNRLKKVAPGTRLVLFLQGWVEYGYSSTNYAASQAGHRLQAPSIHAWRNGQWVELFREVGYPAGINHTMTLDVTGKLLPADQKIRISSNMDLYWDRIFLATTQPDQVLSLKESTARSADLHFLGYPREYSPDGRQPNLLDYSNLDRNGGWKTMQGEYTRFGDVTPLVQETDNCFVIMGPGEEVTLRFPAASFGPVPKGYRRTFLLKTDSYCKDMNYHTAFPHTVGPLPFHGMSSYPYRAEEKYPDTEKTRAYRKKYNTRQVR